LKSRLRLEKHKLNLPAGTDLFYAEVWKIGKRDEVGRVSLSIHDCAGRSGECRLKTCIISIIFYLAILIFLIFLARKIFSNRSTMYVKCIIF